MRLTIADTVVQIGRVEDLPVATTYEVADLLNPGKAKGSFSMPVQFPQTISNSVLGTRDMAEPLKDRKLLPFTIDNGAGVLWSGNAVPKTIGRTGHEWLLQGDNAAWFDRVKDRSLQDLNLGESAVHSVSAVNDSWDKANGLNHFFPLVDYGNLGNKLASYNVDLKYLLPATSARVLMDSIFADLGYQPIYQGTLGAHLDNLYFLFTGKLDDIRINEQDLADRIMVVESTAPQVFTVSGVWTDALDADAVVSDPASQNGTSGSFIPDLSGNYDITIEYNLSAAGTYGFYFYIKDLTTGLINTASGPQHPSGLGSPPYSVDRTVVIENYALVAGHEYVIILQGGATFTINSSTVTWEPVFIQWQEGLRCEIASTVPKIKQNVFLSGIFGAFDCAVDTNNAERTVTITPQLQWRKPVTDALDWTMKMDVEQSEQMKGRDEIPYVFEFRCQEDANDQLLSDFVAAYGRGLGDLDRLTTDENAVDTVELTVPWAATATGIALDSITMPRLLKVDEEDPDKANYGWKPRLVYWDGMKAADWVLDTVAQTEVPEVYFVRPASTYADLSLAFGSNGGGYGEDVGLVDRLHYARLNLIEFSRIVECDLHLTDDDVRNLDFSVPVMLRIAGTVSVYYLLKVDQYLWGQGVSTPCRLIEAVPHLPDVKAKAGSLPTTVVLPSRKPPRR